jgi:hypothetical protein
MGRKRSVLAVYKAERLAAIPLEERGPEQDKARIGKIKSPPSSWSKSSEYYRWRDRADAFDEYDLAEQREQWREQAEANRREEHKAGDDLIACAREMLSFPLAKVEYISGYDVITDPIKKQEIIEQLRENKADEEILKLLEAMPFMIIQKTIIQPVRWQKRDAALYMDLGTQLKRRATGSPTSYQKHEIEAYRRNQKGEPADLFPIKDITIAKAPMKRLPGTEPEPKDLDEGEQQTADEGHKGL